MIRSILVEFDNPSFVISVKALVLMAAICAELSPIARMDREEGDAVPLSAALSHSAANDSASVGVLDVSSFGGPKKPGQAVNITDVNATAKEREMIDMVLFMICLFKNRDILP
ncbi:MAG: hypothetical protein A2Z99_16930 [Treponema sp. GWB1_62_6]|nr:MAG: hypothetical protein A2Z99_16930 [Treponema sp. GWB1_62_6]OHE69734.1 MAG: hypothetical protein A2001_14460 [Treponema sp. GWC1_61_84]OHE76653.1 MAG: hypothetical protein A2413_03260 [Treponema sp. RIFOXYC1_FULL_61_9]HCM26767.1 hypothetical protein [Treponema sp.]